MIYYLGHKVEDAVPQTTKTKRNKAKDWKYGYDPEHDIVVISKDGTLGDVFEVNHVKIGLPKQPAKKDFLNYDSKVKRHQWKRQELPKGLTNDTMYDKQYEDFILQQFDLRQHGAWILADDKPVYLTGTSWFFLQWIRLDEGYPAFRVIQNELLLYWEACKADSRCYGIQYVKNRRFGWSSICNSEMIEAATLVEDKECGIISKTREDGRKMFSRLVRSFKKLPPFFMPVWDGTTTPKSELILSEPSRKRKAGEAIGTGSGLDTEIRFHSTVLNAMDGDKIFRSSLDETAKFPKETPFDQYWRIVKTSHRQGRRIVGKSMVGSTVNAMSKGGREFKNIYDQSNPDERNNNGQTASGLYRIFISAEYCLEGFFDEYGFSIVDDPEKPIMNDLGELTYIGANTFLDNELESLKSDPEAFNEQLRQFPRSEREAFRDEAGDCDFNLIKLTEQLDHNEFEIVENVDYQRGNLTWENGIPDTTVVWRPDPNGRFWIADGCHPPDEFKNQRVVKNINGVSSYSPMAAHIGAFGVDPYNRSRTADGRGSKGAIHLSTKTNTSHLPNNAFILEYLDRPRRVEDFFEDVIKAMVYYSMPMLCELSNESFLKTVKDRGYRNFSLNNPFKHFKDLNPTEKLLGGAPQQDTKIGDQQFYAIESWIEDHVGVARESRIRPQGEMGWMVFSRTLDQWKNVDTTNRTKYDAYISSSLSLLANQKRQLKTKTQVKRLNPFTKYNNTGRYSQIA